MFPWNNGRECEENIRKRLDRGTSILNWRELFQKATRAALRIWNKECLGKVQAHIKDLNATIERIQSLAPSRENVNNIKVLKHQLDDFLLREEIHWKHKRTKVEGYLVARRGD